MDGFRKRRVIRLEVVGAGPGLQAMADLKIQDVINVERAGVWRGGISVVVDVRCQCSPEYLYATWPRVAVARAGVRLLRDNASLTL